MACISVDSVREQVENPLISKPSGGRALNSKLISKK